MNMPPGAPASRSHLSSPRSRVGRGAKVRRSETLCSLGLCLSQDDAPDVQESLRERISAQEIDWITTVGLANQHLVTPALALAFHRKNLISLLPADLTQYLEVILDLNRQRNRLIRAQAAEVITALNAKDIRPLLLKGGLSLIEKDVDDGLFMMTDVDILLHENEVSHADTVLRSLGYVTFPKMNHPVHARTYHRAMSLVTIDLHWHLGPQTRFLSTAAAQEAAIPLYRDGMHVASPCPTHTALLPMMSFAIFDAHFRAGTIPVKGLHNFAATCSRHGDRIDWHQILDVFCRHEMRRAAEAWLFMARRMLKARIPSNLANSSFGRRHLRRCLFQLNHARLALVADRVSLYAWVFGRLRMDYRYNCGLHGYSLQAARLRHAADVFTRRLFPHQRRFDLTVPSQ
jgi:putative nucleotidyltransferase-like protein